MKHLKSKKTFENYKTVTMEIKDLVPASVYKNIPDKDKLLPDIKTGNMIYPLLVFQTDKEYWSKNHLPLYHSGSPELPKEAPAKIVEIFRSGHYYQEPKIHVIWSGRQRFQIAKDLGYTHIDVVVEPKFHIVVEMAQKYKKLTN